MYIFSNIVILVILILVKTRLGDDDGEKQQFTKTPYESDERINKEERDVY